VRAFSKYLFSMVGVAGFEPTTPCPPVKQLLVGPTPEGALRLYEEITGKKATPEERARAEARLKAAAERREKPTAEALEARGFINMTGTGKGFILPS
jgi:hypothetical protein